MLYKIGHWCSSLQMFLKSIGNYKHKPINVTRSNWVNFFPLESLAIFNGLFSIIQNYEPTLVNFYTIEQRFIVVNCHILKKQFGHLVALITKRNVDFIVTFLCKYIVHRHSSVDSSGPTILQSRV